VFAVVVVYVDVRVIDCDFDLISQVHRAAG
jgi:exosome complex RNA-binding protein Rrp42 (RNase PH superfamily)